MTTPLYKNERPTMPCNPPALASAPVPASAQSGGKSRKHLNKSKKK